MPSISPMTLGVLVLICIVDERRKRLLSLVLGRLPPVAPYFGEVARFLVHIVDRGC